MDNGGAITVNILKRPYTVRVNTGEEEIFSQAGKMIEESIQRYAVKNSAYWDKQDLLAMALLETTVTALKYRQDKRENPADDDFVEKLKRIDTVLSLNV